MKFRLKTILIFCCFLFILGCNNTYQDKGMKTLEIAPKIEHKNIIVNKTRMIKPLTRNNFKTTNRALVIGVSKYDYLTKEQQLKGPDNDIILVKETLENRGFLRKNITLLNHRYTKPTRKAILTALKQMVAKTKQGDFIFIYFSGHGAQQRSFDSKADEPDGMDELILPADAGSLKARVGQQIKNAIIDNELKPYLQQLLAKQAFVWFVADSCYSGGLGRGLGDDKPPILYLKKSDFGLFKNFKNNTLTRGIGKNKGEGNMIAFYAVHPEQKAKEKAYGGWFSKTYGVFTHTLTNKIKQSEPKTSYYKLAQTILDDYDAKVSSPLIISSDNRIMNCNIFKPNRDCNKSASILPFFKLPIALIDINQNHPIYNIIQQINNKVPALKLTNKNQAELLLSIKDNKLLITPKKYHFLQKKLDLNIPKEKLKKIVFKLLYRYSKINALLSFFEKKLNGSIKNIDFSISVSNDINEGIFLNLKKGQLNKLHNNDKINIKIANNNLGYRDISLFLIDNEYQIKTLFPEKNQSNRVGDMYEILQKGIISNKKTSSEMLLLISFKVKENEFVQDMRFLVDKKVPLLNNLKYIQSLSFSNFLLEYGISKYNLKNISLDYIHWTVIKSKDDNNNIFH